MIVQELFEDENREPLIYTIIDNHLKKGEKVFFNLAQGGGPYITRKIKGEVHRLNPLAPDTDGIVKSWAFHIYGSAPKNAGSKQKIDTFYMTQNLARYMTIKKVENGLEVVWKKQD